MKYEYCAGCGCMVAVYNGLVTPHVRCTTAGWGPCTYSGARYIGGTAWAVPVVQPPVLWTPPAPYAGAIPVR